MNYQRHSTDQQKAVAQRAPFGHHLGQIRQLFVAESIEVTNNRRHNGNVLVNPPCRHIGGGLFERAVLDDQEGYVYLSDLGEPYHEHRNDFFQVAW